MNPDRLNELLESPIAEHEGRDRSRWVPALVAFIFVGIVLGAVFLTRSDGGDSPAANPTTSVVASTTSTPAADPATTTTTAPPTLLAGNPDPVNFPVLASDGERAILAGGAVRIDVKASTWVLDLEAQQWMTLDRNDNDQGFVGAASAFDSGSGRLVVFGGSSIPLRFCSPTRFCSERRYDQTRLFDPATLQWESIAPPDGPTGRIGHAMAYDSGSDKIVMFGGGITADNEWNGLPLADTWIFDTNRRTWEKASPVESPPARAWHAMTYDPTLDRVVLWGGALEGEEDPTVWFYDVETDAWSSMDIEDTPPSRWQHSMAYDPARDEILVFGGIYEQTRNLGGGVTATGVDPTNEVWALAIGRATWEPRRPAPELVYSGGVAPIGDRLAVWSFGHTMLYDPINDSWTDLTRTLANG